MVLKILYSYMNMYQSFIDAIKDVTQNFKYLSVLRVVSSGSQVAGGEHLPFSDGGGVFHMLPFPFIKEEELVGARSVLECKNVGGAGPEYPHRGCYLVATCHSGQLVPGPYSEDGPHREVRVHDAGPIQRIKCNAEPSCISFLIY